MHILLANDPNKTILILLQSLDYS